MGVGGDLVISVGVTQTLIDEPTRGLLGNINNNPDDDLTNPDGTVYAEDTNDEVIYHNFGQRCM